MGYDPTIPRAHYDRVADDESTRLTRSRRGELNFLVHMDVLRRHITAEHYCHMMTSADVDALLADEAVDVVERRAAGVLGMAGEEALNAVRQDEELWALIVERELAWSKLPGTPDVGDNIVYVIRKR